MKASKQAHKVQRAGWQQEIDKEGGPLNSSSSRQFDSDEVDRGHDGHHVGAVLNSNQKSGARAWRGSTSCGAAYAQFFHYAWRTLLGQDGHSESDDAYIFWLLE